MEIPSLELIEQAQNAGLVPVMDDQYPILAIHARKAGLGRGIWSNIEGPRPGLGMESWYRNQKGFLAFLREHRGQVRLYIFDRNGKPTAEVRHNFKS